VVDEGRSTYALGIETQEFGTAPWYQVYPVLVSGGKGGSSGALDGFVSPAIWDGIGAGWFFSTVGGGAGVRPGAIGTISPVYDNGKVASVDNDKAVPSIFNGDFESGTKQAITSILQNFIFDSGYGRFPLSYELPGWSYHGGSGFTLNTQGTIFGDPFPDIDITGIFTVQTSLSTLFKEVMNKVLKKWADILATKLASAFIQE